MWIVSDQRQTDRLLKQIYDRLEFDSEPAARRVERSGAIDECESDDIGEIPEKVLEQREYYNLKCLREYYKQKSRVLSTSPTFSVSIKPCTLKISETFVVSIEPESVCKVPLSFSSQCSSRPHTVSIATSESSFYYEDDEIVTGRH